MPDPENGPSNETGAAGSSTRTWLLPALAFLAGAALSALLFVVGDADDPVTDVPLAAPTAEATSDDEDPAPDEVVVQVPAVCVEAAELAQSVTNALADVADAAGALDARRLQESLDVVQQIRPEVQAASSACRDLALDATIVTPDPTGSPTPPASPSSTPAS